jgi:hypothetical protein
MKPIEFSCLLLSTAAMSGALLLGTLTNNAHAATPSPVTAAQAAIEACQGKKEGGAVQLPTGNGKTAKAICRKVKGQLVAQRTASIGP